MVRHFARSKSRRRRKSVASDDPVFSPIGGGGYGKAYRRPNSPPDARVRHSAGQHVHLELADVERYPELCRCAARSRCASAFPTRRRQPVADMTVAYKFIHETFTLRPAQSSDSGRVSRWAVQQAGKLRRAFHVTGDRTCDVEFFISYDFKSRTLGLLMGTMFDAAFRRFADFERRADTVYAK